METSSELSTSSKPPALRSSPFKSNASSAPSRQSWAVSVSLHLSLAGAVALLLSLGGGTSERIEIQVIENPVAAPTLAVEQPKPIEKKTEVVPRKVFGVSRKAVTVDDGVAIKQGNTVATMPDNEKLNPDDADSLPIPADEFLVTAMPKAVKEVRVAYPPEAKAKGIEGPVVLDILIDAEGRVRETKIISGPGYGLNEAAEGAVRRFEFEPGRVKDQKVAVRLRYTYRFLLEDR